MSISFKFLTLAFAAILLGACESEEAGPQCAFENGKNVGYRVNYFRYDEASGGIDMCEYATARAINLNYYDSDFEVNTGIKVEFSIDIDPSFPTCPEYWLRFHTPDPVEVGRSYTSLAWVTSSACNFGNAQGWLKFSVFDMERQTASGTFAITEYTGSGTEYNLVSQGTFKNIPLATFNF